MKEKMVYDFFLKLYPEVVNFINSDKEKGKKLATEIYILNSLLEKTSKFIFISDRDDKEDDLALNAIDEQLTVIQDFIKEIVFSRPNFKNFVNECRNLIDTMKQKNISNSFIIVDLLGKIGLNRDLSYQKDNILKRFIVYSKENIFYRAWMRFCNLSWYKKIILLFFLLPIPVDEFLTYTEFAWHKWQEIFLKLNHFLNWICLYICK